jgi:hypothetical protein
MRKNVEKLNFLRFVRGLEKPATQRRMSLVWRFLDFLKLTELLALLRLALRNRCLV